MMFTLRTHLVNKHSHTGTNYTFFFDKLSGLHGKVQTLQPHGQELVEFALVFPLLILVFFGALDLGRVFHAGVVMTNAAREGARYAISHYDKDGASLTAYTIAAAQAEAASSGIFLDTGDVTLQCASTSGTATCQPGAAVRVTVTYEFELIMGIVFPERTIQLRRFVEMMAI